MDKLLKQQNGLVFGIANEFRGELLTPIIKNLLYKAAHDWDDYNEVHHCTQFIHKISLQRTMKMDFHFIRKDVDYLGIALVSTGQLDFDLFFNNPALVGMSDNHTAILNYFHIAPEGRGNGQTWLTDVILKHYQQVGVNVFYVKSSHPKVFSLYHRLGVEIGTYTCNSDNKLYTKQGKIFKISLQSIKPKA